ncbi:MAG: hypothetical protein AUH92_05325 [Acidobacteria bacterium 13_1_40CM_4_69_4]|nr:MAG: hypothetical protein AUH92_05325 [Acidobacteria bacterium 13_1_40CM_4_69_4]
MIRQTREPHGIGTATGSTPASQGRKCARAALHTLALVLGILLAGGVGYTQKMVRNVTPAAWQAADVRWNRDVNPHNKIDDQQTLRRRRRHRVPGQPQRG